MSDYLVSIIRTNIPYIVSALGSFLAIRGVELSDEAKTGLTAFLTWLIGTLYYAIVRHVEKNNPEAGRLLGVASKPKY